jgi:hypothetical protein
MHKYGESNTTRIMMATVRHVTAWAGRTKYQGAWFLLNRVFIIALNEECEITDAAMPTEPCTSSLLQTTTAISRTYRQLIIHPRNPKPNIITQGALKKDKALQD